MLVSLWKLSPNSCQTCEWKQTCFLFHADEFYSSSVDCGCSSLVAAVQNRRWSVFLLLVTWSLLSHLEREFQRRVRPSASAQSGYDPAKSARGFSVCRCAVKTTWNALRMKSPADLPDLNASQCRAVNEVLNNNFTVIWGPPGKRSRTPDLAVCMQTCHWPVFLA